MAADCGVEADRDAAAGPVDDLQPDDREQADRGRPAAQLLGIGEVGGALPGDRPEARPGGPADRAPGVEGPEDVPQQGEKKGKPSQQVTKMKVRAKLRSGASVPRRPA